MKQKISRALFLFFSCLAALRPALAEESKAAVTLSTSTSLGLLYGSAREYVYNPYVSSDYKNSELVWPFEPLFYTGASLELDTRSGFFALLELRQGLAGKTGTMSDSDFLNGDGVKTHYSESDCYTERATLLDVKAGMGLVRTEIFSLGAFVAFSYKDFKWAARNGWYQYPSSGSQYSFDSSGNVVPGTYETWSSSETKVPIYGTGILYETAYVAGSLGLRSRYAISSVLAIDASFAFSPLLYCYSADNHELRQLDFYSKLEGGYLIEPRLGLEYAPWKRASLRLDLAYCGASNLKGDITQVNMGTSSNSSYAGPDTAVTASDASGADIRMLEAALSLRLFI